ncbi:hypothetical protein QFC21_003550 [Naganishia friedmannii]|uniref:Uncharacterized protein n=1 Tax=Naganishia friedmannii TaxID=89922 RepID=A0ACC2VM66_9TREE|nr:hypothetical protein QFC21_003550 [Naganishia friedmannii]
MSHPLERTTSNSSVGTVTGLSDRAPTVNTGAGGAKTLRYQNPSLPQSGPSPNVRGFQSDGGSNMRGGNRPQSGPNEYSANGPGAGVGQGGDRERGQQHAGYPPAGHHYPAGQQGSQGQRGQEQAQQGQPAGGGGQPASSPAAQQQGPEAAQQAQQNQNVPWGGPFPSLHLWPLNETFVMKMIHLPPGERVSTTARSVLANLLHPAYPIFLRDVQVKIGRQTNAKTQPGERNGYFDSKVLSRMHAEIWGHDGKMFIKDVKSSNGTFINGDRLSAEGLESEPFELKSEDMVEFGIDIISEDNKTIVHHKVSAKAYCVFNVDDAGLSVRELSQYYPHDPRQSMGPQRRNGNQGPLQAGVNPSGQSLGLNMMSAGGKAAGLNFDHVLHRLQTELQKSKDTGADLQNLTGTMTDIQETLNGNLPPDENGNANQYIPPHFRPLPENGIPDAAMGNTTATIAALQAQLSSTQSILISHKDRIRALETLLNEQEAIKEEVLGIRQQLEESKREYEVLLKEGRDSGHRRPSIHDLPKEASPPIDAEREFVETRGTRSEYNKGNNWHKSVDADTGIEYEGDITDGIMDDFEDARSTSDSSRRSKNSGPAGGSDVAGGFRQEELLAQNNALSVRLDALSSELEQALALSRTLQTQHAEATSTVKVLEERVQSLEKDMARQVVEGRNAGKTAEDKWEAWRSRFEEGWRKEKEGWELERERLRGVVREWEEASRRAQEEEEERLMNSRIKGEDSVDQENEDEDAASARSRTGKRSASRPWPEGTGVDADSEDGDEDDDAGEDVGVPFSPTKRSHDSSNTPHRESLRGSRRESSSRLDPAIRALRATAGDLLESQGAAANGSRTPRTGSPSAADGALEALRNKSGRPKRAKTITGRQRHSSNMAEPPTTAKPEESKTKQSDKPAVSVRDGGAKKKEDGKGSDGNNTSTESDETAHGHSRDDITVDDESATITRVPVEERGSLAVPHPIPLAVSVAIIAIAGWAYVNRVKE